MSCTIKQEIGLQSVSSETEPLLLLKDAAITKKIQGTGHV